MGGGTTTATQGTIDPTLQPLYASSANNLQKFQQQSPLQPFAGQSPQQTADLSAAQRYGLSQVPSLGQPSYLDAMALQYIQRMPGMAAAGPTTGSYNPRSQPDITNYMDFLGKPSAQLGATPQANPVGPAPGPLPIENGTTNQPKNPPGPGGVGGGGREIPPRTISSASTVSSPGTFMSSSQRTAAASALPAVGSQPGSLSYDASQMPLGPHGVSNIAGTHGGAVANFPGLTSSDPQAFLDSARGALGYTSTDGGKTWNTPSSNPQANAFAADVPDWAKSIIAKGGTAADLANDPGWKQNASMTGDQYQSQLADYMKQQQSKQYAGTQMQQDQAAFAAKHGGPAVAAPASAVAAPQSASASPQSAAIDNSPLSSFMSQYGGQLAPLMQQYGPQISSFMQSQYGGGQTATATPMADATGGSRTTPVPTTQQGPTNQSVVQGAGYGPETGNPALWNVEGLQTAGQQGTTGATAFGQSPGIQAASQSVQGDQISSDPAIKAALDNYRMSTLPQLQNQMALAGLGNSTALGDAMQRGQASMLQPLYENAMGREQQRLQNVTGATENELQRRQTSATNAANANTQAAQMMMQLSQNQNANLQGGIGTAMQAGGTAQQTQQASLNAQYQDMLRRQALSEQGLLVPFGQTVPSAMGSRTSTSGK